jgi:phosphatidylcholine synthase
MRALAAWVVHCLTAGGAAIAVLALLAIEQGQFNDTLAWLVVALVFDGIDGPIARAIGIKQIIPQIDGAVLDLVVDYLTFVFIPAHLMLRAGLLPESMALYLVLLINGSALYHYSRTDMKTPDN